MEIGDLYDYDVIFTSANSIERNWMHRQVCINQEYKNCSLAHLIRGYSSEGWNQFKPMNANANAEIRGRVEWGGEEGIVYTIDGSASVSDDHGDHIDLTISQDSNGHGSAEISAGARKEKDKE